MNTIRVLYVRRFARLSGSFAPIHYSTGYVFFLTSGLFGMCPVCVLYATLFVGLRFWGPSMAVGDFEACYRIEYICIHFMYRGYVSSV